MRLLRALKNRTSTSTPVVAEPEAPSYFGVTRYSVFQPTSGAWKLTRNADDASSYQANLWSEERMRPRAEIFLGLVVPILDEMGRRHDYRHVVQYSDTMPEPWLSQLRAAADRYPVLYLMENSDNAPVAPLVGDLLRAANRGTRAVVQFRLDDDDLLAADYLDRVSAYATPHDIGRAISLAVGYSAFYDDGSIVGEVREVRRVFGSQGLAYVGKYDAEQDELSLLAGGKHYMVDRKMPTIVDSRQPAFFQMRHVGQDTLIDADAAVQKIKEELRKRPAVASRDAVVTLFPTLDAVLAR